MPAIEISKIFDSKPKNKLQSKAKALTKILEKKKPEVKQKTLPEPVPPIQEAPAAVGGNPFLLGLTSGTKLGA